MPTGLTPITGRGRPAHRVRAGAAAMSDAALRIVLRHELFHYAARADTALDAPRWLTEGWPTSLRGHRRRRRGCGTGHDVAVGRRPRRTRATALAGL
ncbi:peptidase MA superfamily protein [Mycobacterium xenopi 4042]|uniref:Peptidase MA superfamily protein n=1 Tax=Mycobacterium xenopi 4042 TaxID=1299334 RepID=X7ZWF3_MYCXE|nr:peptidase MA superfamily protein [Mycobacterium xenopi 4042]